MTIRLPGILDEINPMALQGISSVVNNIVNPNAPQQLALRQMMLQNPELQQQLTDMGTQRVEEVYGKGTGGFAGSGPKSLKKQVEDTKGAEIQRILTSGTPQEKEELLSSMVGTKTSADRTIQQQTIESNNMSIEDRRTKDQRERDNRILANQAIMKAGGSANLYRASTSGKLSPEEQVAIRAVPEYKDIFESQQNDYWRQQQLAFQRDQEQRLAAGQRDPLSHIMEQQDAMLARQYADQANRSNAQDIFTVLRDKSLYDRGMSFTEPPKDPKDLALYEAAHAVEDAKTRQTTQDTQKQLTQFRLMTQGITAKLNNPTAMRKSGLSDGQIQAMVDQYNTYSAMLLRPYMGDNAPLIAYDTKGKNSNERFAIDRPTIRFIQGGDPGIEPNPTQEKYVEPAKIGTPLGDPVAEKVAQGVVSGKYKEGEAIATAKNPDQRDALKRRIAELRQAAAP